MRTPKFFRNLYRNCAIQLQNSLFFLHQDSKTNVKTVEFIPSKHIAHIRMVENDIAFRACAIWNVY